MEKEGERRGYKKTSECLWFNAHKFRVSEILQLCPHLPFQAEIRIDNRLKTWPCNWPLKILLKLESINYLR